MAINSSRWDDGFSLSSDELTAYISSRRSTADNDNLYVTSRESVDEEFITSRILGLPNTEMDEGQPQISADGRSLFYSTPTPPRMFVATRLQVPMAFTEGTPVPGLEDVEGGDPLLGFRESELFFWMDRGAATGLDIVVSKLSEGQFLPPEPVSELNSVETDAPGAMSPDGLTFYLMSSRPGGGGGRHDIWIARRDRVDDEFGEPEPIVELNGADDEWPEAVSADGCTLYFASRRAGYTDIWYSKRAPP